MSNNTAVDEKDIPKLEPVYHNVPETLEDAIQRIMQVEMLLEDLSRATEIATITRQFEILDGFKRSADDYLEGKITIEQPTSEDLTLTVVEGEVSEETKKALKDKYAKAS